MTVAEMLKRVSAAELAEWRAYERIVGPLGGERDDINAGVIAKTIADVNRSKGVTYKLSDFVVDYGGRNPEEGDDDGDEERSTLDSGWADGGGAGGEGPEADREDP